MSGTIESLSITRNIGLKFGKFFNVSRVRLTSALGVMIPILISEVSFTIVFSGNELPLLIKRPYKDLSFNKSVTRIML